MIFVALQANWSLGADPLMSTTWDADLPDLTLHGEQHSPSSGMGETDYLSLLVRPQAYLLCSNR